MLGTDYREKEKHFRFVHEQKSYMMLLDPKNEKGENLIACPLRESVEAVCRL